MTTTTTVSLEALRRFGHAVADPTRSRILLLLADGPAYPSDIAATSGASKQSVSNHLSCLRGCGLVVATPEGRRQRYELADPQIGHALRALLGVVVAVDPSQCASTEPERCC